MTKRGLYYIIPYEKDADKYIPDWYILAGHLARDTDYYIGYYSALQIHNLITQPSLKEQMCVAKQVRPSLLSIRNLYMIKPGEIQKKSTEAGVRDQQIEKDYVISWILQGIAVHDKLSKRIVFKGGTVLKKAYFMDYRFSEDLGLDENTIKV